MNTSVEVSVFITIGTKPLKHVLPPHLRAREYQETLGSCADIRLVQKTAAEHRTFDIKNSKHTGPILPSGLAVHYDPFVLPVFHL